jgi:hypothetical protein
VAVSAKVGFALSELRSLLPPTSMQRPEQLHREMAEPYGFSVQSNRSLDAVIIVLASAQKREVLLSLGSILL